MALLSVLLTPRARARAGGHGARSQAQGPRPREAVAGRRGLGAGSRPEGTERGQLRGHRPRRRPQRIRPRGAAHSSESLRPGDSSHVARVAPGARPGDARPGLARRRRRLERAGGFGPGRVADPACPGESPSFSSLSLPGSESGVSGFVSLPMHSDFWILRPESLWLRVLNFLEIHLP